MNEGLIPRRYAKALYLVAKERNDDKRVYQMMKRIEDNFVELPQLNETLNNPFVSYADKQKLVVTAAAATDNTDSLLIDFIKLLMQNRRIGMVRLIAQAYINLYREENHIYKVEVESAAPMNAADEARLKRFVEKHLHGGTMEYTHSVNPSLIGGFTVSVGNERVDASVSNELKQLRLNLISK